MEVNRPAQHKQPSRKGKKSWIKNIDLEDLNKGLEKNRDNLIKFGVEGLNELDNSNLFVVDTKGDEKVSSKPVKILKSTEILNKRSKVPELEHYKHKKGKISKKDYDYLMSVSGRNKLESATKATIDRKGLVTTKAYDVWTINDDEDKDKPEILKKFSASEWTKPKNIPSTLQQASIIVEEVSKTPDAGRSYNPSLESWKDLIQREYTTEKQREDIRLVLQEHAIKIKNLLKNIDNNEEEDDEDDNAEESVEEKEHTKEDDFRLSINKPVVNKKKTKTQRNRQRRHQESVKLHAELRDLKEKIAELEKIPEFESQIREPSKKHATTSERIQKRKKLGTKHQVKQQNLDIKLSDELTDSLRGLKPEGNLLQDTMFSIQSKGQVEARIPIKGKRRYQQKVTEKWTYKDFK